MDAKIEWRDRTGDDETVSQSYWIVLSLISACIVVINVFTKASDFADYDTYVIYLDGLVHFPSENILTFEGFSNIYLLTLHWLFRSVETTVIAAHAILGAMFVLLLAITFPAKRSSWQSIAFIFAMLGPLLAFVTLRATPAYFLAAVAARMAQDRRKISGLILAIAAEFHISSLLAFAPILVLFFNDSIVKFLPVDRPRYALGIIALAGFLMFLIPQFSGSLNVFIQSIPSVAKYVAYTDENITSSVVNKSNHIIFAAFISTLTITFLSLSGANSALKGYVVVSFLIYLALFLFTSPVAAFRQVPFWVMPMIANYPWRQLGINQVTAVPYAAFCVAMFVLQFAQVHT